MSQKRWTPRFSLESLAEHKFLQTVFALSWKKKGSIFLPTLARAWFIAHPAYGKAHSDFNDFEHYSTCAHKLWTQMSFQTIVYPILAASWCPSPEKGRFKKSCTCWSKLTDLQNWSLKDLQLEWVISKGLSHVPKYSRLLSSVSLYPSDTMLHIALINHRLVKLKSQALLNYSLAFLPAS